MHLHLPKPGVGTMGMQNPDQHEVTHQRIRRADSSPAAVA